MRALGVFLAIVVLPALLVLALLLTGPGTRWLVQRVDALEWLEVEYAGGNLLDELRLARLRVAVDDVSVSLDDIALQLERSCLLRSEFCFRYLRAGDLRVEITDDGGSEGERDGAGSADSLIEIPWPLRTENLRLDHVLVRWPGGAWEQGRLEAAASFAGSSLRVSRASLRDARLRVDEGGDEGSETAFDPPRVFLPLKIIARNVSLDRAGLSLAGWQSGLQGVKLGGEWRGTRLEVQQLDVRRFASGDQVLEGIAAPGFLDFDTHWPIGWALSGQFAESVSAPALRQREIQLGARGDFSALELRLDSAGEPALSATATLDIAAAGLPFSADGRLAWPRPIALADALGAGPGLNESISDGVEAAPGSLAALKITQALKFSVSGDLERQVLQLEAGASGMGYSALRLRGKAEFEAPLLRVDQLILSDTESQSEVLFSGELAAATPWSLSGQFSSPGWQLPADLLPGAGRLQGAAELAAQGGGGAWQLRLPQIDLDGSVNGMPASVRGHAGVDSELRLLPGQLEAQVNGAKLQLSIAGETGGSDTLDLSVDDLGRWVSGGRGSLSLRGRGKLSREQLRIAGSADGVQVGELSFTEAELSGEWGGNGDALQAKIQVPALNYAGQQLEQFDLSLQGTLRSHRATLAVAGDLATKMSVEGGLDDGVWRGELAPLQLDTRAGPWQLERALALTWQPETRRVNVAGHCWRHPDFELCARRLHVGLSGDVDLRLTGDVSAFNGLLPPDLNAQGELEALLEARWGEGQPAAVTGRALASDIVISREFGLGESASLTWDRAQLNLRRGEDRLLNLDGRIDRDGRRVIALAATLPPARDGEIDGTLELNALRLSALAPWAPLFADLGGELSGDLRLGGQLLSPRFDGSLSLTGGHAVLEGNPTALTEVNLQVALRGRGGSLEGAGLLGGGPVRLAGSFGWQPDYRFDLSVAGEAQRLLLPPSSEILVAEDLSVAYADNTLDLRGDIHVNGGVLRQEELPEGGVALSSDVVEVDAAGNAVRESQPFQVNTDFSLYIDDRFEVRSDYLQAVLGGKLHLEQKPPAPPQVFGTLNISGGELRAFRQRLEIRRGTVDFNGPLQNPSLDVIAERRIRSDNVTVGAQLFGSLETPQLEIYSDPPMSQGEAMSYLVRGRGLDAGAGADGTALALAVGADVVNRSGVVEGLNRLPLINNLAFGSSGDEEETAATVAGYLGDRIYLSYGVGLYEPINEFSARLYLQSRLWLEVVSRLENSVDLYYSFDID